MKKRYQQGESIQINFFVKENGVPIEIGSDEYIAIGFYGDLCDKYVIKTKDNSIQFDRQTKLYHAVISGDVTKNFSGSYDVEVAIYDKNKNNVSQSQKVGKIYFDERNIIEDV